MAETFTIGKVAAATGVTVDTIRYYERLGLLPRSARTESGYRQYPPNVVNRLALVRNAQRFGFSLKEIAGFLKVRDGGGKPCHTVRAAAAKLLDAVDRQIEDLVATRERMKETLRAWDETLARTPKEQPARLLEMLRAES